MVQHLAHNPKIEVLNPGTDDRREKNDEKSLDPLIGAP